jgi:Holliday junction resolvasome RuvABC endonuclease subunit
MISFCGCDPGLAGGWAVISGDEIKYKMAMPTLNFKTRDGKTKTEIDRDGVLSFLKTLPPHTNVAIEEVQAFRKQNITSTCTTCKNYGILLMALTVTHMYITEVPSDTWQEHFGIVSVKKSGGESTKEQAFHIAQVLYPNADFSKSKRSRSVHDGMVDATLIATYCQAFFVPTPALIEPLEFKPISHVDAIWKPSERKSGGKALGIELKRRISKI